MLYITSYYLTHVKTASIHTSSHGSKHAYSSYHVHIGSVWIELIVAENLKLKTENWKHCSKIIFKCVNSIVGPIFNEKIDKK